MKIRDRIRELRRVKASELLPNPKNPRTPPKARADSLRGLLAEIGYADALIARELPDGRRMVIDAICEPKPRQMRRCRCWCSTLPKLKPTRSSSRSTRWRRWLRRTRQPAAELLRTITTESEAVGALLERIGGQAA